MKEKNNVELLEENTAQEELLVSDKYFEHFKKWMESNNIDISVFNENHYIYLLLTELYYDYRALLYQYMQEQAAQQAKENYNNKSKLFVPEYVLKEKEEGQKRQLQQQANNIIQFPKR